MSLNLPQVHQTKETAINLRVSRQELEQLKETALQAGYVSVSDLLRAGVVLVRECLAESN